MTKEMSLTSFYFSITLVTAIPLSIVVTLFIFNARLSTSKHLLILLKAGRLNLFFETNLCGGNIEASLTSMHVKMCDDLPNVTY